MFARPARRYGSGVAPPIVRNVLRTSGQPLGSEVQATVSAHFGYDFSEVRVHADTQAGRSAEALNANAYHWSRHRSRPPQVRSRHHYRKASPRSRTYSRNPAGWHPVAPNAPIPVSGPADVAEKHAQHSADDIADVHKFSESGRSSPIGRSPMMVQRDLGAPTPHRGGLTAPTR